LKKSIWVVFGVIVMISALISAWIVNSRENTEGQNEETENIEASVPFDEEILETSLVDIEAEEEKEIDVGEAISLEGEIVEDPMVSITQRARNWTDVPDVVINDDGSFERKLQMAGKVTLDFDQAHMVSSDDMCDVPMELRNVLKPDDVKRILDTVAGFIIEKIDPTLTSFEINETSVYPDGRYVFFEILTYDTLVFEVAVGFDNQGEVTSLLIDYVIDPAGY